MGQGDAGKAGLVPRLRFPEFREAEGWEVGQLGALCELYQPITLSSTDLSMSGEYFVYGANGVIGTHNEYNHEDSEIAVTCRGATCGEVTITKPMSWITGNAMLVKPRNNKLRKEFLFHYLKNHGLKDVISGSAQPQITRSGFAPLKIFLPNYGEQQRIADCLTSIDTLIIAQTQKLDALKIHKQGLMQQLFPQEGETLPRLRFPEFREAEGWDGAILGDLSVVVRGGSPRPIDGFLTTSTDGLNWLKIGDVDKEAKFVIRTADKVRPEALSKTRVVNPGDLILSNSMSFGRPYILQIQTCIHDGWIAITDLSEKIDRDFLYYLISAPASQSYFVDNAAGSGVQNLNADIIKALPVPFPSLAEQKTLASCLSSADELITAQTQKLDALKTHKKGLMQQLFPSVEEVATT
jgi:type I restriction enzyme S subunit